MAKEEPKGVEDPSAANLEKPGVIPSEGVPPEGTPAAGENQDEKIAGLTAAAMAEREKRQAAETESQVLKDQLAISQQVAQPQPAVKPASMYQAVAKGMGIDPELATPEEQGMIFDGMIKVTTVQQTQQSFVNSHPDFAEVVGVMVGNNFRYAPPLERALKANPALADALKDSPNSSLLAYEIAKKDPQYLTEKVEAGKSDETKAAEKAQAEINAAKQQLSISAAKGGGGNLDQTAAIAAMTDEEFRIHNEKIMAKAT